MGGLLQRLALENGNNGFHRQVNKLSSDGKVEYLLPQTVRVDLEGRGHGMLLMFMSRIHQSKNVKFWDNDTAKGNIDECSEEDGDVRANEVKDEDLLSLGSFVCGLIFIVFKVGELGGDFCEETRDERDTNAQDNSGKKDLQLVRPMIKSSRL